ncbi:hypothetical protein EYZ11_008325 [Aspergillus tanneri]|uniref:Uncharacterized protein n=1 Tax=Aspergillus tanneri TaxID=1220188 RepID=A0A4S3JCY2_9EURO|nr:hypothetical protein EYZ11_008325 [Aspergillus tanneri]
MAVTIGYHYPKHVIYAINSQAAYNVFSRILKNPERLFLLKLDLLLLVWAFVAGLTKVQDMDQSATTQAFVSGMKESLGLYGNELVEFTTYFSVGYALAIVPSQMIQTMVRPSVVLPVCEIIWGSLTLA